MTCHGSTVFRALADPTRRGLLDELFKHDGQTLGALGRRLTMTRFGVMKHLRVLEEAGLVVTQRRGREKLHFLNPVPIRLIHDRWIDKYTEPWAAMLSGLKHGLEEGRMEKVFEIYIKTTPERLWQAITDPEMRRKYTFGVGVDSDWTPGSRYVGRAGDTVARACRSAEGENLEVDPPRRLVQSFRALWSDDVKREGHVAGHLGDRADRRLLPPDRDPRPAPRGGQQRALRRLADGAVGPQDAAGDRRAAHHAGLAAISRARGGRQRRMARLVAFTQLTLDGYFAEVSCGT